MRLKVCYADKKKTVAVLVTMLIKRQDIHLQHASTLNNHRNKYALNYAAMNTDIHHHHPNKLQNSPIKTFVYGRMK